MAIKNVRQMEIRHYVTFILTRPQREQEKKDEKKKLIQKKFEDELKEK